MKIDYSLLLVVFLAPVVLYSVAADSEEVGANLGTKGSVLSKNNGNDGVNDAVDPAKKGKDINLNGNDSTKQLELKGGENKQKKVIDSAVKDEQEQKQNKGSDSESKKGSKEETVSIVREKCDSSSNSCMDDEKAFVACLRVPGDESPELSLLIQNKGKGPLSVTISAPDLVKLEKNQIQLKEKEDTEVPIRGVESGQFIILTAGHGTCRLNITDQHGKKKGDGNSDSTIFSLFQQTSFIGFLAALAVVVSVVMCIYWRRRFARTGPKYQKLDMELPVSHGSKHEPGMNEGWDDSWGDSWDDEEAPKTPSFPLTPSLSSKGMASRKFNKDGWKD